MRNQFWVCFAGIVCVVLILTGLCQADEIYLKNGDRITGKVISLENEILTVEIDYVDKDVKIDWKEVERVVFNTPASVDVYDQDPEQLDPSEFYDTARLRVESLENTKRFPLSRIKGINTPDIRYKANIDFGGNRTSGNTDTTALNGTFNGTIWSDRHRLNGRFRYTNASADGEETANNSNGSVRYDYFYTKRLFFRLAQSMETDNFQDLKLRSTTGVNIGYQFIDTSQHTLDATLGPAFVYQEFSTSGVTQTPAGKWFVDWEYKALADRLVLYHTQSGARDFGSDSDAFRWNADQGVRVALYKKLYFNLGYEFRFNSEPELGKKQTDEALNIGLGYALSN